MPEAQSFRGHQTTIRAQVTHRRWNSEGSEEISSLITQLNTVWLALLAVAIHAIVVADGDYGARFQFWIALQCLGVIGIAWRSRAAAGHLPPAAMVSPLLVICGLGALVWEGVTRQFLGTGLPFELLTMSVVRNVVLGLAVVSLWPGYQRMCVVLSLFLALFGATAGRHAVAQALAGLFAVGSVVWLVVSHWENVRRRLHGRETVRWPVAALAVPCGLFLLLGIGAAASDRRVTTALSGWLPSSGGDHGGDPYARGGVGDGEMLVAGSERVQSFAPIDDAPFMQDDKPSLYDLFDDTYDEPLKVTQSERAIALPPDLARRATQHLHTRTEKANREFSTLRKAGDQQRVRKVNDILSQALFFVAGRVPLHLRMEVYDLFDGVNWHPRQPGDWSPPLEIVTSGGKPWLILPDQIGLRDYLGPAESHALKVVNLDANIIPAPLYLHGIHIDRVDREDMYTYAANGLVAMNRDRLPALVPIHITSRTVHDHLLAGDSRLFFKTTAVSADSVIPGDIDRLQLRDLAAQWAAGRKHGWDEIRAIVKRLHTEYQHDPAANLESTASSPVVEFLFESKRGPDYQFATAAALLLRSLGYATRVVSGFYADPLKYDARSRHTPVLRSDVHFWTEVRVAGGDWVTVEPTPGYAVLGPPPGVIQQLQAALLAGFNWCRTHWLTSLVTLLALGTAVVYRGELRDQVNLLRWRYLNWRSPERRPLHTFALLRMRASFAKRDKSIGVTAWQWLRELGRQADPPNQQALAELGSLCDRLSYARIHSLNAGEDEAVARTCQACIDTCTLRWFRALNIEGDRLGSQESACGPAEVVPRHNRRPAQRTAVSSTPRSRPQRKFTTTGH